MNSKQKEQYLTPIIEVIEMQTEGGVMIGSLGDVPDAGSATKTYSTGTRYNAASRSELEDLINDILTIEQ